ncbi:hypothetical protein [Flavobacterium sp. ABG]|uniref:hypothetical protein n=1 Tax=Flavobacterium sp. ABG TaxID=1423322 RepID=UPI00064A6593|nr:hypothetical protein [Flavobacterium sp. ABG]KLT69610.1 hypothetical protein AB674_11750 [Flavobacterium sp. ABG]
MNTKLYKTQIDYISLKVDSVDAQQINWNHLIPHPTLRKQYVLVPNIIKEAKNFRLYAKSNGDVIISLSIPYFLFGYNYRSVGQEELTGFYAEIKSIIGIDIKKAEILEFEYGGFEDVNENPEEQIQKIIGMRDSDLVYSKPQIKIYAQQNNGIFFKIYDAVYNAKLKKTYSPERFPKSNVVKYEIKITNPKQIFKRNVVFEDLLVEPSRESVLLFCMQFLSKTKSLLILQDDTKVLPKKYDLINILYAELKNLEKAKGNSNVIHKELIEIINSSPLSSSQKSKRRKAIGDLDSLYCDLPF